jgi:hypothetical protein
MLNEQIFSKKKRKTILVLGSKPNAKLPITDFTYCANASASYYHKQVKNRQNIKSIVSASEVILGSRKGSKLKDEWIRERTSRIANLHSNEIILYNIDNFPEASKILQENHCKVRIKLMTCKQMFSLITNITKKKIPMITNDHFNTDKKIILYAKYIKNLLRLIFFNGKDINGLFRPSTGITTLIYAISKHGKDAEYFLSGISIQGRGIYPDGSINTWSPKINLKTNHVYVDREILSILSRKYTIRSSDDVSLKRLLNSKKLKIN